MTYSKLKLNRLPAIIVIIVAAFLLLTLSACTKQKEKEPEVIKIGAILPMTGNLAWFGEHAKNSCLYLEKELNAQKKQVEIHIYDSKSTPKDGLSAYRKMIMENIRYSYISLDPVSKAIIPNIEKDKVLVFVGSVDNEIAQKSRNVFRCYYGFKDQTIAQYKLLKSMKVKSAGMVLRDVSAIRKYSEELLGEKLKDAGIFVKGVHLYASTTKDFRSILIKMKSESPDALVISEYGALYPTIFKQLDELNLRNSLTFVCGLGMLNVKKDDYHLYEGVIFTAPMFFGQTKTDFRDNYINIYGRPPTYEAYYCYDSVKTLFLALKNSKGSIRETRDYILNNKFQGISQEEMEFDENGDLKVSTVYRVFRNGEVGYYK